MNIYLICASSYHLIDLEIKKIVKDQEYILFNLNKNSISELLEEASYSSLDNDLKIIVATNASFFSNGKISDKEVDSLIKYFNNPNPKTIIIFTCFTPLDNRKRVVKIIKDNYKIINILPWDKKKMREEASRYLEKYQYKIDYNTLSFILDNVYNNIDIMYNELDKIMLYYNKSCFIKKEDVEVIIGKELDSNNFHFVDAVIEKNLEEALRVLKNLKVYKVETVTLINLLAREYRLMYSLKKFSQDNLKLDQIKEKLNLQDWQVNKIYKNSLNYKEKELLKNIYRLAEMDLKIKKGIYDKELILNSFLLEVCV